MVMKAVRTGSVPAPDGAGAGSRPCRTGPICRRIALLGALLLGTTAGARAEGMAVEPGDVLRVTVAEAPTIGREDAKVDADGRIMLPVLGGIAVAGSDLDAIRTRIADRLVAGDLIRQPTVVVEIASYRPFYVGGSVANPGAVAFEPGLTVRHALILAGGLDRSAGPDRTTTADLLDLKTKWRTANYELLLVESRIARLEAELDHGTAPDFGGLDTGFVAAAGRDEILSIDRGLYDDRAENREADKRHMQESLALIDLEIGVLTKQADLQNQEQALQRDQVEKARVLVDKGVMPLPRLQELEREASRMSRDLLDNQAYTARAKQNKQSQISEIDTADAKWRIEIRGALSAALLDRTRLRAESEVLASALLAAGVGLATDDNRPPEPDVVIHRAANGTTERLDAGLDTEIRPGDVLEVSIAPVPAG